MTFSEAYALSSGVSEARFARRMFWLCLHRRAMFWVPFLAAVFPGYFQPEAQLLAQVGRARSLSAIDEEIRIFRHHDTNQNWLRRRLKFRLSTRRLRRVAVTVFNRANEVRSSRLQPT
jgi:hypothetical protein